MSAWWSWSQVSVPCTLLPLFPPGSATGGAIVYDENADRVPDFWILDLDENGAFHTSAYTDSRMDGSQLVQVRGLKTWISDYIQIKQQFVITHPCHHLNGGWVC